MKAVNESFDQAAQKNRGGNILPHEIPQNRIMPKLPTGISRQKTFEAM